MVIKMVNDKKYMTRALKLAEKARGLTSPNPMVGAVVVNNDIIVGEGYHKKAGGPHAEVFALQEAGNKAKGATIYITLEPCCHYGKTPPCTDAIINAGISRVVFASTDVDKRVSGRSVEILRGHGIDVDMGLLSDKEMVMNEAWRYWKLTGMPFVTLKLAASLDGKTATRTGESKWITSDIARRDVHKLRAISDGIITTSATVMCDDSELTARIPGAINPRRVVVDAKLHTMPDMKVFSPAEMPTILATLVSDEDKLRPYHMLGLEILTLPPAGGGVDLYALMEALGEREIVSLMVEAGGRFAASLIAEKLVNKFRLYLAPMLIGGETAPGLLGGFGTPHLADAPKLEKVTMSIIGPDFVIEGYFPC